jgi:hypothetical protein
MLILDPRPSHYMLSGLSALNLNIPINLRCGKQEKKSSRKKVQEKFELQFQGPAGLTIVHRSG